MRGVFGDSEAPSIGVRKFAALEGGPYPACWDTDREARRLIARPLGAPPGRGILFPAVAGPNATNALEQRLSDIRHRVAARRDCFIA
jgi:hypothetical protein